MNIPELQAELSTKAAEALRIDRLPGWAQTNMCVCVWVFLLLVFNHLVRKTEGNQRETRRNHVVRCPVFSLGKPEEHHPS